VKKSNLFNSLFSVLLLSSPLVIADTKFPAANFEPQVVYQDADYIKSNAGSSATSSKSTASSGVDKNFPAANFEPTVIYSDDSYKHHADTAVKSSTNISNVAASAEPALPSNEEKNSDFSLNYLLGIVGLISIAGFLLRGKFCAKKSGSATAETKISTGLTGVARYLNRKSGTGVSRYIEKQVKFAATTTGVAKYLAKHALNKKSATGDVATGVEKYMRNRG